MITSVCLLNWPNIKLSLSLYLFTHGWVLLQSSSWSPSLHSGQRLVQKRAAGPSTENKCLWRSQPQTGYLYHTFLQGSETLCVREGREIFKKLSLGRGGAHSVSEDKTGPLHSWTPHTGPADEASQYWSTDWGRDYEFPSLDVHCRQLMTPEGERVSFL